MTLENQQACPYQQRSDQEVWLFITLQPKAARDDFRGLQVWPDGRASVKIAVTAIPENNKANDALVTYLAKAIKWPKTQMTLAQGAQDRRKTIAIHGAAPQILPRLTGWLDAHLQKKSK